MRWSRLYRRLCGGIWVKYWNKADDAHYWLRYKSLSFTVEDLARDKAIEVEFYGRLYMHDVEEILKLMIIVYPTAGVGYLSDGHHSFNELYAHRNQLFANYINILANGPRECWKSRKDSNGVSTGDWFIAGIYDKITYHLPMDMWNEVRAEEIDRAKWDGHNSYDVLSNLRNIKNLGNILEDLNRINSKNKG